MAVCNAALVLVLVMAPALAWENLPSIPANRRAQYYLQHDDGAYKFGYDTGEGHSAQASADAANQVQGEYSYVDGNGQAVNWQYTAGDGGYVPVMRGAPAGGPASGASVAKVAGFGSRSSHGAPTGVVSMAAHSGDSADADYDENADASYNFNIDTDSYKRTESSDAKGNIKGEYSYNSPVGGSHAISYIAGEGTGFVVTSADASQQGSHQSSGYDYQAPPQQSHLPPATSYSGAPSNGQTQINPDGSFAFSYSTSDHDHQATADAQNNVRGSYSFVAQDDGQRRRIDYEAGSATGYVATGAHVPVAPSVSSASSSEHSYSAGGNQQSYASSGGDATIGQTVINPDGSFSYSYSTSDHSKQESADAHNNVRGSFSFKSQDDGKTRTVDYVAGADTGFVATGDHLPVAPSPAAPGAGIKSGASHSTSNQASGGHSFSSAGASTSNSDAQSDGSYSFSYNTDDHSHHAASDAQGNVAGSFSFVADDGVSRKIDYTAGADKGFVAKGAHLPVSPAAGSGEAAHSSGGGGGYQYAAPPASSDAHQNTANNDGSYSYSYDTGSSSKQESADAQGNVAGSFSFLGGDGVNRKLTYTARGEEGFIAMGDHLPVAPAVAAPGHEDGLTVQNAFAHPDLFANSGDSTSHGSASSGTVMASKDGAYSYAYNTGGSGAAAPSYKSSSAGQNSFGSGTGKSSSSNTAGSSSSATGHVKASKDGEYSYSYSTGGQSAPAASSSHQNSLGSGNVNAYVSSHAASDAASSVSSQENDGSYSFSYDAGTHSHEQSSDPQNNVRGSFSFKASDGQARKVDYTAGAATGFVAKGAHLPVAPPAVPASVGTTPGLSGHSAAAPHAAASSSTDEGGDASYSYSYKTDTSSKQESSDAQGNVMGTFSFVGGDGVNRKLTYTAKNEEGFNAAGDHLPVAPSVVGGESHFSAKSASSQSQSHRFSQQAAGTLPASTSHLDAHPHAQITRDGNVVISTYLPPDSVHKFGYIFDTKA